jgi:hypothetical protein
MNSPSSAPANKQKEQNMLLKLGMISEEVRKYRYVLSGLGFWDRDYHPVDFMDNKFTEDMKKAVIYFQQTHVGSQRYFLDDDGIIGKETAWALEHPDAANQKSSIEAAIPDNIGPLRHKFLEILMKEYMLDVKEVPNGSNRGERIDVYTKNRAVAWCCKYMSWALEESLGDSRILGRDRQGSTYRAYQHTKENGMFYPLGSTEDIVTPGDLFMIQYKDERGRFIGKGHIGAVLRSGYSGKGILKGFNTNEGNSGNRIKIGLRDPSQKSLIGFINPFKFIEPMQYNFENMILDLKQPGSATR